MHKLNQMKLKPGLGTFYSILQLVAGTWITDQAYSTAPGTCKWHQTQQHFLITKFTQLLVLLVAKAKSPVNQEGLERCVPHRIWNDGHQCKLLSPQSFETLDLFIITSYSKIQSACGRQRDNNSPYACVYDCVPVKPVGVVLVKDFVLMSRLKPVNQLFKNTDRPCNDLLNREQLQL